MPELPEVETVMQGLKPFLLGKTVEDMLVRRADLRVPFPAGLADLKGRKITNLSRRAKYILIYFDEDVLVIHLGMSGRMVVHRNLKGHVPEKHDHMLMIMQDGGGAVFNDPRRFGLALLLRQDELATHPSFCKIGPEPLEKSFGGKALYDAIRRKKSPIKTVLLDQRVVAGIGNIYACEALYDAGIDPRKEAAQISARKCDELVIAIKKVLKDAIAAGGSSLKDYRKADGTLGYFQHGFKVYDREGEPCPRCARGGKKAPIIKRMTQTGRSTFFCPACQK